MPLPPLRAAIIDLDGTLIDTVGDFELALNLTLADMGLPTVDLAYIRRTIGKGSEYLIARTLRHVGADDRGDALDGLPEVHEDVPPRVAALRAEAFDRYQAHYREINGRAATVFPGAAEGLQRLADVGLALACLTNKPGAHAEALLTDKGLRGHFAHVFGGDAFARKKPDPLPVLEACRALGTAPAETLMLGDSSNDAEAGRAAGCPVVLVSYGYNHGQPVAASRPDAIVDRIDALALPGLWSGAGR